MVDIVAALEKAKKQKHVVLKTVLALSFILTPVYLHTTLERHWMDVKTQKLMSCAAGMRTIKMAGEGCQKKFITQKSFITGFIIRFPGDILSSDIQVNL